MNPAGSRHHCLKCGTPMNIALIDGRPREQCPQCGWIHYLQRKLSAAALIEEQGKLLLLQRAHQPWQGYWNLPAGYLEVDETPEQAIIREAAEETGLEIEPLRLLGNYTFEDDPRGNGFLVVYLAKITGGKLRNTAESQAHGYFSPDALPGKICGAAHDRVVQAWARGDFWR
jgi:ADP-ribose pyrophosphatase YjhB (NUDIX family)